MNKTSNQTQTLSNTSQTYLSIKQVIFLALVCCLTLANMYAAQPILADIAQSMEIDIANSGIIITLAQLGYCTAVLFLVPLGDALENRKLVTWLFIGAIIALLLIGLANNRYLLLAAFFLLGLTSSLVQIIIPYSTHLIAESQRGKFTGFIVSGASLGMVMGRPVASFLTELFGWQMVFVCASLALIIMAMIFRLSLPVYQPSGAKISYYAMLKSMLKLLIDSSMLRCHIILMTLMFCGFTLFWATIPIVLQGQLGLSHSDIALFSLVSLSAPICVIVGGIMADRGRRWIIIGAGIIMVLVAFMLSPILGTSSVTLLIAIFLLDSGVNMTNVQIQQSVLTLEPSARSRLNALCISIAFMGGALGSYLGPWLYKLGGWQFTSYIGGMIILGTLVMYLIIIKNRNIHIK